jgi:hypothetical protein
LSEKQRRAGDLIDLGNPSQRHLGGLAVQQSLLTGKVGLGETSRPRSPCLSGRQRIDANAMKLGSPEMWVIKGFTAGLRLVDPPRHRHLKYLPFWGEFGAVERASKLS